MTISRARRLIIFAQLVNFRLLLRSLYRKCKILEITFTFSHGTGFKAPKDFAKQPRLELTGKHEKSAMFVFFCISISRYQSSSQFRKIVK
jgi:hypothetical protein